MSFSIIDNILTQIFRTTNMFLQSLIPKFFFLLQNTCYELQCPFGKYAWYGKCEKKFSILRDACLCVILYIEVLLDHAMQQMDNNKLDHYLADSTETILHQTLRIAKWDEMVCLVEPIIARTRNDDTRNPAYNISLAIHINSLCNLYDVTENIMKRQLGVTTVNVKNETNMDINIKLNLKRTNDNAGFNTCQSKIMCYGKMRLNNDIVCPQIGLNYSDAERFSSGQKAEVSAFLSFFDSEMTPNKTTTVWVCLEKYLKTISESNGDYPSTADWTVTLISILLVNLGLI